MLKLALIEDDASVRESLALMLQSQGVEVQAFDSCEDFLKGEDKAEAILSDIRLPGLSGPELLEVLQKKGDSRPFTLMSAYGTVDTAIRAMRRGAFDYITKPVKPVQLRDLLDRLVKHLEVQTSSDLAIASSTTQDIDEVQLVHGMVGESAAMKAIFSFIEKVAAFPATVLLRGESGTGKERIARAIHEASPRAREPFVTINCGAIPENLLESELFGVLKGSYTGADKDRLGVFRQAEGGTILLDEIGELPLHLQVKLLRVLQEKEVRPVGASTPVPVDVRVIAASLKNLSDEVEEGRFRQDLYFRLNVMEIEIPPLRQRLEDISPITQRVLSSINKQYGKSIQAVDARAMDKLMAYSWPGNIRQLENVLERACILTEGQTITAESLQIGQQEEVQTLQATSGWKPLTLSIKRETARLEAHLIQSALEQTDGHQGKAAKILEISPRALVYKIKEYGLK
jgi:two-component system response regulator AtoC